MEATTTEARTLPIQLQVSCANHLFANRPVTFERWSAINYLVGPNGSGKTTIFNAAMQAARNNWPNRVKILGTGRLGPLEKSVTQWIGDTTSRLFQEENIDSVYNHLFSGRDTSHEAFQILEKRLDLQIRVLGFLRHVFKKTIYFRPTRRGLEILGSSSAGSSYQIIDECHGLKELITILTFLYDETFSVLGIDEPELHLHPQFQRFLLDELRAVAGDPSQPGKKLIFLVTHSPILLEMRTLADLASIVVFSHSSTPERASPWSFTAEEQLKVKQCLPAFHAGQRELLFSNIPVVVEGPSDVSIVMNVATKLALPLGAAGIGITSMGGKYQLLAFRSLLGSLAKPSARFVLDLDAVVDTKAVSCLDSDARIIAHLASVGHGDRSFTRVIGELIALLRAYIADAAKAGAPLDGMKAGEANEKDLAIALRLIKERLSSRADTVFEPIKAQAILGKVELIRAAARAANVLILSRGPMESYYAIPPSVRASDFEKQQALQAELDAIWQESNTGALESRYAEILDFLRDAGFLKVPIAEQVREPIANLIHILQTEILTGRVRNVNEARQCSRAVAEGYWHVCQLTRLEVSSPTRFSGTLQVKVGLGGEVVNFSEGTRAYELATLGTMTGTGQTHAAQLTP
jgi:hypothetical protein